MKFSLRPTDATFFDLFTSSAQNLVTGARLLSQMLPSDASRASLRVELFDAEHAGDEVTHAIVRRVNTTFVTPFDREDIYRLAGGLDDIMDFMEEAGELIQLYQIATLPADCAKQVQVLQRCADLTAAAMPGLATMSGLEDYWIEINRLENDGDRSYRRILADLVNGQYEALDVIKLKGVVDALENAIDGFETVANTVEQIAVKES